MTPLDPLATSVEHGEPSIASLVTRCVYEIATGAWIPGQKLLSVREAERRWGLDRRAVLKAYQRLEELGLVQGVDRSGYYVVPSEELGRVARHRHELEAMYERLAVQIIEETGLSELGLFRYFAQLAEQKARHRPECAFVECTATQAQGHAREVVHRLGVPCLALTTSELDGRRARIPAHVRTLLVTGFHYGELKTLCDDDLEVLSVPIEVSPRLAQQLRRAEQVVIVEWDETEALHIRRDLEKLDPQLEARLEITDDVDAALSALTGMDDESGPLAMLSPRIWGAVEASWRDHPNVALIEFSIVEDTWSRIADVLGLPLGDVG